MCPFMTSWTFNRSADDCSGQYRQAVFHEELLSEINVYDNPLSFELKSFPWSR